MDINIYSFKDTNISLIHKLNQECRRLYGYDSKYTDKYIIQPSDLLLLAKEYPIGSEKILYHTSKYLENYTYRLMCDIDKNINELKLELQSTKRKTIPIDKISPIFDIINNMSSDYIKLTVVIQEFIFKIKTNSYSLEEIPEYIMKFMLYKTKLSSFRFSY